MATFRKKPVVIEAWQWKPEYNIEFPQWMDVCELGPNGTLLIKTLEGVMCAAPHDWIIRGIKGEVYPCKPDIFEATYDAVDRS